MKASRYLSEAQAWYASLPPVPGLASRPREGKILIVTILGLSVLWTLGSWQICLFRDCHVITSKPGGRQSVDLSSPEAPFIAWPLARACSESSWLPGLVFACDNNSGGIGNIRNYILTCIRYGIEAGATGLVLPQIQTRSEQNLSHHLGYRSFDYFFDEQHFRTAMRASCPQITIYNDSRSIPHLNHRIPNEMITPSTYGLKAGCDEKDLNRNTDLFAPRFRAWIVASAGLFDRKPVSLLNPRLVRFNEDVYFEWPVYKDGPEFANSFGGILRFSKDILRLGNRARRAMQRFSASVGDRGKFIGMHLRTEQDLLPGWPNYEKQSHALIHEASREGFRTGYLATGNSTESTKLAAAALTRKNLRLVTKHELLKDPEDMKRLKSLTWDQQGAVDFIVLLQSNYFVGVSPSSFSINVAGKRHLKEDGLYTRPWKVGREGDGGSFLVGWYENYWENSLFVYDSLWP